MGVKERLIEYIKYKRIPVKQFEQEAGLSNGYVSSIRRGIGTEKLDNVLKAFPDLNRDWLLYGEGNMVKENRVRSIASDVRTSYDPDSALENDIIKNMAQALAESNRLLGEELCQSHEEKKRLLELLEKYMEDGAK